MAACGETFLLQSVLDLDNKQASVSLTPKCIAVEHPAKARRSDSDLLDVKPSKQNASVQCQVIPLEEVICVQPHSTATSKDKLKMQKGGAVYQAIELQPQLPTAFDVYIVKRASKHRWRHKILTFSCEDHPTCMKWIESIRELLCGPGFSRPKQLLVFVNPYGGKNRAPKVFEKVRNLFELAGIALDVIETERQYHAQELLKDYDISSLDGVVCVGGDGTFSEVLNGVLNRCQADQGVSQSFRHQPARPALRIGVIPGGSTDSIVCSTTGIDDPVTSALQIVLGYGLGVDVNALYKQEAFVKYSVTMTSYGFYGDVLVDSEKRRWMGPPRYTFSGFKKFVVNKSYEGEVSFLPADKNRGHPQDGNVCYTGCEVCKKAGEEVEMNANDMTHNDAVPTFDLNDGNGEGECPSESWHRMKGKFMTINAVSVSCRCGMSPEGMSPFTHLGDGCLDLILVSSCSRFSYLRHLMSIPNQNSNQFDFGFVKVYRVREFQFQPAHNPEEEGGEGTGAVGREVATNPSVSSSSHKSLSSSSSLSRSSGSQKLMKHSPSQNSVWNCDGEVIEHPHLHIQVHCQLIRLFARGVEDHSKPETETCPVCCNPCRRY